MIYRVAPVCRQRQAAHSAVGLELHGILYQERFGGQIGLDIGTHKDKDAVACRNIDIAGHHPRVAIDIQAETRLIPSGKRHLAQTHSLVTAVIHLKLARGGAHLGEHRIKRHRVARELQLRHVRGKTLLLLARSQHRQQQCCRNQRNMEKPSLHISRFN